MGSGRRRGVHAAAGRRGGRARCRSTRGWPRSSTRSSRCTTSRSTRRPARCSSGCAPSTTPPRTPCAARARPTREPIGRSRRRSAASCAPFQWAGVRYALDARRAFLADEQGLGKTVEALAALEADGAYPAVVVCPASLKLNWQRETEQLAARTARSRSSTGRGAVPPRGRHHDPQLRDRRTPTASGSRARARRRSCSTSRTTVKNPRAKRTQAVRRLAERGAAPTGCGWR